MLIIDMAFCVSAVNPHALYNHLRRSPREYRDPTAGGLRRGDTSLWKKKTVGLAGILQHGRIRCPLSHQSSVSRVDLLCKLLSVVFPLAANKISVD